MAGGTGNPPTRADEPPRRALKLMVEYAADIPLWVRGGNLIDLTRLHLPPELVTDLITWQRHFNDHFSITRWPNWDSREAAEWHAAEGPRLFERLHQALPKADLTLDMWVPGYD